MKTLEEKALEKAEKYYDEDRELRNLDSFYDGYIQGATEALQSQWRSVEDELPIIGQDVLIAYFGGIGQEYFDIACRYEAGDWYSQISEHGYPIDEPTHWLPIPKYEPKSDKQC